MKTLSKISLILSISFLLIIPFRGQAISLPKLLPDCDQTVYVVEKNGNPSLNKDECKNKECIYARDYADEKKTEEKYGKIQSIIDYNHCGFEDFKQLLINFYQYGMAILSVVVLFFFIWGGFNLILAAGRAEKIKQAKDLLKGTFIGMLVVLTSWAFVNFYIFAFTGNKQSKIFNAFWYGGTEECHKEFSEVCDKNDLHYGCGGPKGSPTDHYVQELQKALNKIPGCDCGPVDGCFGEKTFECVVSYQIGSNLLSEEGEGVPGGDQPGIVGQNTWDAINLDLGQCISGPEIPINSSEDMPSNMGCCKPYDNAQACYDSQGDCKIPGEGDFFEGTPCILVNDCALNICVFDTNNCVATRDDCGEYKTNKFAYDEEEAKKIILNIPKCNMGTCTTNTTDDIPPFCQCKWESRQDCEKEGGEFFYNIPTPNKNEELKIGNDTVCICI